VNNLFFYLEPQNASTVSLGVQADPEDVFKLLLNSPFYTKEGRYAPRKPLEATSLDPEEFDQIPDTLGNILS
jgi:hypothetical protein